MEARLLAKLRDKARLPFISVSEPITCASFNDYSFLVQITQYEVCQLKGMAAIVEAFNLRDVILIYEETDLERDDIYLIDSSEEKNINVNHKIAIAASFTEKQIIDVLHSKLNQNNTLDQLDLVKFRTSKDSALLLKEIVQSNFVGLSGQFQIINGKLSPHEFEIVNFIGKGDRRVGFLTNLKDNKSTELKKHKRLVSLNDLETVVWPGGSTTILKGPSMMQRKLRILVPQKRGFTELVRIDHDNHSNSTYFTGFCIDVFKAAVNVLEYQIDYELIPFPNASRQSAWTYDDLKLQVFLEVK
ncbi:hypothetical protein TIFTF001_036465 [Ficus carica]|uniref:Receptor ligand binding region domain-containing protein n=1 Tax=Ficus carica TaxID=3494 RepID=A0AA88E3E6_FICCA|nr:hypothetical protein TIFTF001_036457 [Ficus carica]GMN67405.1 hypothetical protein TIFTF001_036465 [Ficus carica]